MMKYVNTFFLVIVFVCSFAQEPMLGEIRVFAGNYAPSGWVLCNGQTLSVSSYDALYSLIGNTYGGSGTTFAVPNLAGRVPVGAGSGTGLSTYALGSTGGSATITFTEANLPAHSHTVALNGSQDAANADNPSGNVPATTSANTYSATSNASMAANSQTVTISSSEGGGDAQNNVQPYVAINYIMATSGIYNGAEDPYLGEIRMIASATIPDGWLPCDGSVLSIASNNALYSLLGATYGGNRTSTFALPDLRGRVPISQGAVTGSSTTYARGDMGGEESQLITESMMAAHEHAVAVTQQVYSGIGDANTPVGNYPAINPQKGYEFSTTASSSSSSFSTGATGSGQAVSNIQPYCTIQYIICTSGLYPSRP